MTGKDVIPKTKRLMTAWRPWLIALGLVSIAVVAFLVLGAVAAPPAIQGPDLSKLDQGALEAEKLRQEIRGLQIQNASSGSPWTGLLPQVPVLVAGLGLIVTVWHQLDERSEQRKQQAREAKQEEIRRFDESFAKIVEHLGADNAALRASALVSLTFLLTPEYEQFHDRVLLLAVATARAEIPYSEAEGRLFVDAIEKAVRVNLAKKGAGVPLDPLDLSRVQLNGIDLSNLDLTNADLAFASLHHANLKKSHLFRVRGYKVELSEARLTGADLREARLRGAIAPKAQFHSANCVSARLEEAVLTGAQFYRAHLQEVHFEGADLTGAHFEDADLNNAYLGGAVLDASAIKGIATGAKNWRKAHFDPDVLKQLHEIGDRARPSSDGPAPPAQPLEVGDGDAQ